MRIPRIYDANMPNEVGASLLLDDFGANHVSKVLRLQVGDHIRLFDGIGNEYLASLTQVGKKTEATLVEKLDNCVESPITIELLQVISRGDRMDFTVQKAVELGIARIIPLTSERCGVKLDAQRADKKIDSYQKIAFAACEQCGRNVVPKVEKLTSLQAFIAAHPCNQSLDGTTMCTDADGFINITLDPRANCKLSELPKTGKYRILIGPEGGFTPEEVELAANSGFVGVTLGPRILRTETTALVSLAILGASLGDL